MIACTQPRRLAVQGITRIKFLTDGVLLREMMDDPLLSKYSVIMVDEAHERSISTDVVLGLLKKIQKRRPDLRLVISSATIEERPISSFFHSRNDQVIFWCFLLDKMILMLLFN
ncbi:hypothetical protein RND81_05G016700 [Saponaria officinalis]|uniref:RNA helicase n=1 Tax=Saponaria officinalis TaxID=3572 RepID=A0AAW1KPW0_SAPOF